MPVSATTTFDDVTTPRRPSEGDMLNGAKTNVTPVVPPHMPAAEEYMQMARTIVALADMVPLAIIAIQFSAGTPSVHSFISVRSDLLLGDITLTDHGAGDTSVTLPAAKFPSSAMRPQVSLNAAVGTHRAPSAEPIANGARVRTTDGSGAATDIPFVLSLY